jgi:hypothetical protein
MMKKNARKIILIFTGILLFLAVACDISFLPAASNENGLSAAEIVATNQIALRTSVAQTAEALGLDLKPETAAEASAEAVSAPSNSSATQTLLPCNKPAYQSETIPDNSVFKPGEEFIKTWTIQNAGTCSWTTDYKLVFKGGDQMGGPSSKNLTETINPGESLTLRVDLTAPASSGIYTGTWKVRANDGEEFGKYWATIMVKDPDDEAPSNLAVTSVSFTESDQMKVGFCPHMFNLQAEIKVNGKGTVKYHWVISNGFTSAVETLTFDSAGTKTAILNKNLSCSGTSTCSYVVELFIDSPNNQMFGAWPIAIHCL